MGKDILTVRFIIERDYWVQPKSNGLGCFDLSDMMVMSGHNVNDTLKHESVFDNPVSAFRPFKGIHLHDANLHNIQNFHDEPEPWLLREMHEVLGDLSGTGY